MDALALLCNLHADGPATLQKLRKEGCHSLALLFELEVEELSERLDWEEHSAERFLREARLLAERLDEGLDWDEEEEEAESGLELVDEEEEPEEDEEEAEEEEPDELEVEVVESQMEEVLGTWRELDRDVPPAEPTVWVTPVPAAERAADQPLAQAGLEGLSRELLRRLSAVGVYSLRELVERPTLELRDVLGIGYTRIQRLQFLAERELRARREALEFVTDAREPVEPEAHGTPQASPGDAGTAGPFA